ncbi:MAG TPA: DUF3426 domain-containing protein [Xanthobacteraceae bacterium]|nr:DUF3426 domain-containing protein [Xanthobacteraceae bacterium]
MVGAKNHLPPHRMLLACPHCATIYDVSRSVIGANGRSLRCARCETVWFATQSQELLLGPQPALDASAAEAATPRAQDNADALPGAAPTTEGADGATAAVSTSSLTASAGTVSPAAHVEDIESAARRRELEAVARIRRLREQLGSPTIIAVLSLIVAFLFAWRTPIVQIAPQMASFYAAIGLPVNLRDLVFRDIRTFNETRDGVSTLVIEGVIASTGRTPVEVPRLRLALRDATRQEIVTWTAAPEQSKLAPGETLSFRSRLATPPEHGHDVVVRFLNQRDATEGGR